MEAAGIAFAVVPADLDERAVREKLRLQGKTAPSVVAEELARAKAETVSRMRPDALVIGADQILALGEEIFEKPADLAAAREHLLKLRGREHRLHCGVAIAETGRIVWSATDSARLLMRAFSTSFLDAYLERVGSVACESVGAYQLEGQGVQLFERIDGDYFTILGLPLLPLLAELRARGALSA
jgi:septum formation protein